MKSGKIFSVDAEVDGLYGQAFAVAVRVYDADGTLEAVFDGRVPDRWVKDPWVKENVLPALGDMEVTHETPEALLEAFWAFWIAHKEGARVLAHCGAPVETNLFRRAVEADLAARQWGSFYPYYQEVGMLIDLLGEDGSSVDGYLTRHGLQKPAGVPHHPGYDSEAAYTAYRHALNRIQEKLQS